MTFLTKSNKQLINQLQTDINSITSYSAGTDINITNGVINSTVDLTGKQNTITSQDVLTIDTLRLSGFEGFDGLITIDNNFALHIYGAFLNMIYITGDTTHVGPFSVEGDFKLLRNGILQLLNTILDGLQTNVTDIGTQILQKQDVLTAGTGITISGSTISSTGGGASYTASLPLAIDGSNNLTVDLTSKQNVITSQDSFSFQNVDVLGLFKIFRNGSLELLNPILDAFYFNITDIYSKITADNARIDTTEINIANLNTTVSDLNTTVNGLNGYIAGTGITITNNVLSNSGTNNVISLNAGISDIPNLQSSLDAKQKRVNVMQWHNNKSFPVGVSQWNQEVR